MGHSQPWPRRLALELGQGGWGSGGWLQLSSVLCPLPELPLCLGPGCVAGNCSWTAWAPWRPCSHAAVGWASSAACGPTAPGAQWTLVPQHAWPTRNAFCNLRACPGAVGGGAWQVCPSLASGPHPALVPSISSMGPRPRLREHVGVPATRPDPCAAPSLTHSVPGGWSRWAPGPGVTGAVEAGPEEPQLLESPPPRRLALPVLGRATTPSSAIRALWYGSGDSPPALASLRSSPTPPLISPPRHCAVWMGARLLPHRPVKEAKPCKGRWWWGLGLGKDSQWPGLGCPIHPHCPPHLPHGGRTRTRILSAVTPPASSSGTTWSRISGGLRITVLRYLVPGRSHWASQVVTPPPSRLQLLLSSFFQAH